MVRRLALILGVFLVAGLALTAAHAPAVRYGQRLQTEHMQRELAPSVPQVTKPPAGSLTAAGSLTPAALSAVSVAEGEALAVMRIPRFGTDWEWIVVEGVAVDDLVKGPGHYSGTPLPGARGNVAVAGHRAGHGDPFIDFDRLQSGDEVILSQGEARWVYVIDTEPRIVPTSATWVVESLPGKRLTLTTCWPKYGSSKRMYVRAHLEAED